MATAAKPKFVKVQASGEYAYGWCVRVGRKDRLDTVGILPTYDAAYDAMVSL